MERMEAFEMWTGKMSNERVLELADKFGGYYREEGRINALDTSTDIITFQLTSLKERVRVDT